MRLPIIAGNWKMNTNIAEAVDLVQSMVEDLERVRGVEIVICPPFVSLYPIYEMLRGGDIRLGAQNMEYREPGAYTGEIAARMISPICQYVILGHSERRQYYGETDDIVHQKLTAALRARLTPIVCVGERLEEREHDQTEEVLVRQVRAAFSEIATPAGTVVAYEPVWAIGTGRAATADQANEAIGLIRRTLAGIYDENISGGIRIQYGGSVTAANAAELLAQPEIDGALVGGASLKAPDFLAICQAAHDVMVPEQFK